MNGSQGDRKIPMFASWGHKFRISYTTCKVIITAAGPNPGGGGEGRRRAAYPTDGATTPVPV